MFNASREVAGLLGITIIGVILRAGQTAALHQGQPPLTAFLSGYRLGLVVAGVLVCAGGVAAWVALRNLTPNQNAMNQPRDVPASAQSILITD